MKHFCTSRKAIRSFKLSFFILFVGFAALESKAQTNVTLTPSQTWTVPPGVTSATFYLWGGGGAGAATYAANNCYHNGGGGGGGACVSAVVTVVPGQTYTFTGGAGGVTNPAAQTAAGSGGTTTFAGPAGTWTAGGGAGAAATGGGVNATNAGGLGSSVGSGPGFSVRAGGNGSNAVNGGTGCTGTTRSGSGGGGGGSGTAGSTPPNSCSGFGGAGGTGTFPGGAGGYNSACGLIFSDGPGLANGPLAGATFGGGGAGAYNWSGGTQLGGAGGQGRVIVSFGAPACSGTPTPGNTISSISSGCSGDPLNLSLQNITNGTGVTYQWQSSPTGSGYTDISGATSSTYSTTLTATTFFQCIVSCPVGGSGTSNPVQVTSNGSGLPQSFTQTTFPPCGWTNANSFCLRDNVSAFGIGNGSAKFDFYNATANINLTSPTFTAVTSGTTLTFDFAYSAYDDGFSCDDFVDELRIRVSSDGGATYTAIVSYIGGTSSDLNPFGLCSSSPYTPTSSQWSSKSLILPAGTNRIQLRGIASLGNNLFLDNISLNIPTPCSGPPSPGNTVASTNNQCTGTDVNLSLPSLGNASGYSYAWQTSPDNIAAYTNIAGATNSALTIQPTTNGWYRCRVTCSNGGQSANSTPVQITVVPCIIMVDGLTANACGGTFYDGGGPSGNYGNNNDRTTTICPSSVGSAVKVTFSSFDTEDAYDPLYIYDGPTNGSPIFSSGNGTSITGFPAGGYWGTTLPGGTAGFISTDPSGCLTFRFRSDGSVVRPGWAATLACIAPCSGMPTAGNTSVTAGSPFCASQSFTLSIPGATVGGGITYQWQTSPNNNTWTNATGAGNTSVSYTTTQSTSTWYRCIVTCAGSGLAATSVGLQVLTDPDFINCYCSAIPTDAIDEEIYRFFLNGIGTPTAYSGGTSGCSTPAPGPGSILNRYSNFKTLGPKTDLLIGVPSTFQVNENECDGATFYSFGTGIWIDYNHNGSFNDPGEAVFVESAIAIGPRQILGSFTVPATALPGITGLRVIVAEDFAGASLIPCLSYNYGETEDWLVNIIPPNITSNTPVCEGNTITLQAPTTGTSYLWSGPNGFTSTDYDPQITLAEPADGGTYTVVVTTATGSYTADGIVVVNPTPSLSASGPSPFCEGTQNLLLTSTAPTATSWSWTGPGGYTSSDEDPTLINTDASMTGNYKVVITDVNGCKDSSIIPVTIYELPNIVITPSVLPAILCTGTDITLFGENIGPGGFNIGGATYVWSTAETGSAISVSIGGYYTVTGTDGNNCINTNNITVTEVAPPAAPVIVAQGDINLCSSDGGTNWSTVVLHTVNYSTDLLWSTFVQSQDITAYYPGDYFVIYIDPNTNCSSESNVISTTENYASTDPLNSQVSSNVVGNITCATTPITLTLAEELNPLNRTSPGYRGTNAVWKWYLDGGSCGAGSLAGTGASITVTPPSTPGPHTYSVRAEGFCNTTNCASIVITVKDPSVAATSSSASLPVICEGDQTVLSVSGGQLGTGASWVLYENTCGGAALQSSPSPSFTVIPQSPGLHTYFIRAEGDCNNTSCSMIIVDVKDSSAQAVSLSSSTTDICEGGSVTMNINGGHLGRGAVWSWYEGGCSNGAPLQSGVSTSLTITPQSSGLHTYYARAEGDCNTTNCASIVITVKAPSVDPTGATASVSTLCAGDQTQLSVVGGSLGTGAQWKWYAGSCGGAPIGFGPSVFVNTPATTTYYVRAEGDCNTTLCQSTTVTVSTPSTDPTSASSNAPVNGICLGNPVTLTVSGGTLGTGALYKWYEDGCGSGGVVGTGASITITPAVEGLHSYYVRAEGPCNTTNCVGVQVLVGTLSVEASGITSSVAGNSICTGNNITLTLDGGFLGTVAQWKWYSGSCGGTAAGTGTSITVNPAVTTTYFVRAEGSCNNTNCASITVNVSSVAPVNPPPTITTAPNGICSGNGSTVACNAVTGATFYSWSAPNGTTFDGNNPSPYITTSNSVQVTFGNLPNGISGYDICVFAGNGCGNTVTKCRYIRGRVQGAQTITGNASSCPNTTSAYSIASLPGADSYTWTVTGAATINGGGTTLTTTATTVNVNFLSGWTSGTLTVYGSMNCGYNGPAKTITIISTPVVPGVITGPALVCPLQTYNFSIAPVAGASAYNWSTNVPGAVIGAGTTSRNITFPAVIPPGSTVSVTATGSCGTSLPRVKNIATGLANAPGTITGPATGQCGSTTGYSILPVAGATSYLWTADNGATIFGLNNITTASVVFPVNTTPTTVSVVAINGCGNSAPQTKAVIGAPASPGVIAGPGAVCVGIQAYTYTVPGSTGATAYVWNSPINSTILTGQNTNSVSILFTDNTSGNITVYAQNLCGVSSTSSIAVSTVCRQAQIIQGSLIDAMLYPNPTIGTTTLRFETITAGDYKVSVVDMTGQIMQTSTVTAVVGVNMRELDLSTYAKGLYMVRMERDGEPAQMLRVTVE